MTRLYADHLHMILRLQEADAIPLARGQAEYTDTPVEAQPIVTGEAAMAYYWSNRKP